MKLLPRLAAGAALVLSATAFSVSRPQAQAPAQAPDPNAALTLRGRLGQTEQVGRAGIEHPPAARRTSARRRNMPLRALITFAYQLQPFQLVEDPSWIRNENFDIVAKMEGDPPPVPPGTGT